MKGVQRWRESTVTGPQYEAWFIGRSAEFKRYPANMYLLNRAALRIQHWFFSRPSVNNSVPKEPVEVPTTELAPKPVSVKTQEQAPVAEPSPMKRNRRTRQSRGGRSQKSSFVETTNKKPLASARAPVSGSFVSRPKTPSMKTGPGPMKTAAEREAERIARVKASRKAYSKRPSTA
jgi:hypothetical protein